MIGNDDFDICSEVDFPTGQIEISYCQRIILLKFYESRNPDHFLCLQAFASYLFVFHKDCALSTISRGRALLCFMLHLIVRLPDVRDFML